VTICYWGGYHGAKKHVQNLMQFNGKKFCVLFDNSITVEENIVHWHGYLNKEDAKKGMNRYWDNSSYTTILYRDGDELFSVTRDRRRWERVYKFVRFRCNIDYDHEEGFKVVDASYPPHSLIQDCIHRGVIVKGQIDKASVSRKKPINMSKEYAEKYKNDPKLKNTMVHHEAVKKSKISKMITIDDVPDCHLLIPYDQSGFRPLYGEHEDRIVEFYSQDWNRYRNIVPYKSNLVDSARNFLDVFDFHKKTNWKQRWDYSVFDAYKADKKAIWEYLDKNVFGEFESAPKKLKEYGIEFEYFDLDKDNYKKTFEIDEDPLFRLGEYNIIDQLKNVPTKETRDRFHRLTDIAKEYVAQCGREDNRITL